MTSVVWGLLSAAGLGTADFMARFSARSLGAPLTYAAVLLVGAAGATLWTIASGSQLVWSPLGWALAMAHGISVTTMCVLLYMGLARGPVAIVAPIVAAHPAPVLLVNVLMGTRPTAVQWAAMSAIVIGGLLIARSAEAHPQFASDHSGELHKTIRIALGACLAYVLIILTGQAAVPLIGELQTVLIGRWTGLLSILLVLLAQGVRLAVPMSWVPFLAAQGLLDGIGYAAFLAGSATASPHITMVVSSSFSVVTVLLAKLVLKEPISGQQWCAVALIVAGSAALAGAM